MKVGDLFKYRHSGAHRDCTLQICHDEKTNRRYLYDISCNIRIGEYALLYAKKIEL